MVAILTVNLNKPKAILLLPQTLFYNKALNVIIFIAKGSEVLYLHYKCDYIVTKTSTYVDFTWINLYSFYNHQREQFSIKDEV